MATSYTSLLGLALPVTGELAGTWGDTVNNSITALLDTAVAGTTTLSTDADVTLTTTTGATNQARQAILLCSGARTAVRNITAPAQSKIYAVINNTTGGYGVVIRGVGPTTGVTVASGKTAVVVWNGSDFVEVAPATATTATNLAGGAAGSLPYQSGAGATTFLSIGTNNFVLTSNGTAPVWTTNTGTGNVVRATSPTLVTPVLGTPTSGTLTNCTGLPISTGISGLGANVATFLATPSSANLAAAVTDETGSGALVFGTNPTLVTPTFTTSATFPMHIGGTGTTSTLTLRSTSGVGTTGADIIFQTGNNGATEAMRILNSGNVGIGTNNPLIRLHVENAAGSYNSIADNSVGLYLKSNSAAAANNFQGIQFAALSGNGNNSAFTIGISSPATGYSPDLIFSQRTGVSTWVERMHIDGAGNVGIGTSSPSQKLQVVGAIESTASNAYRGIRLEAGGGNPQTLKAINYLGAGYTADLAFNTDNGGVDSEKMRILGNGNVGIGTTVPSMTLDIRGASTTSGASRRLVYVSDTTTGFAAGVGGGIGLAGIIDAPGTVATFGGIQAQKESSTAGVQSGYLTLVTNNGSTLVERMRIDSSGNVGIGTSSIAVRFQLSDSSSTVYASTSASLVAPRGLMSAENTSITTGSYSGIALNAKNANNNSAIGYIGVISEPTDYVCDIVFGSRTGATSYAERMRIDSTGNIGIGTASPVNKLDVVGSFGRGAPVTKTGNFTLAATENWVICNGTGTITVTLPAASSWTGREVMIKTIAAQTVVSASSNVVPLAGGAAGTAILAATAGRWATLVSDGTNWVIMSAA